jgi:predicted transcriptional regulator
MLVLDNTRAEEVVRALSDEYSRKIIKSIMSKSEPIEEISREQGIPISTCYRRVHELLLGGIVRPDKTIIQEDGKKYVCYRTTFKNATINLGANELTVDVILNRDESTHEDPLKQIAAHVPLIAH